MELCLFVVVYCKVGLKFVLVVGVFIGFVEVIYECIFYYLMFCFGDMIVYFVFMIVFGVLFGGLVVWGIVCGFVVVGVFSFFVVFCELCGGKLFWSIILL